MRIRWLPLATLAPLSGAFIACLCAGDPAVAPAPSPPATAAAESSTRELLRDPRFERGFVLLDPAPGKRVPYGVLTGPDTNAAAWFCDQWSSRYPLAAEPPRRFAEGAWGFTNAAKAVLLGPYTSAAEAADLTLTVRGILEYAGRARQADEPWVHLLVEQDLADAPSLAELSAARLRVEGRLLFCRKLDTPDYSPSRHAAQFQIFFTVQNRHRSSPGYGQYLWFGVPLYDDRSRFPRAHAAQDTGGTSMFIYTPGGEVFSDRSAHDPGWIVIDRDVLPLMREGLETAWKRGFLTASRSWADYRITSVNLGWEVPGLFDASFQIRRLSLRVTAK